MRITKTVVTQSYPGHHQAWPKAVRAALSFTQCCPGQSSVLLNAVPGSAQFYSMLSWTVLSFTQHCPGQNSVLLNAVPGSAQFYSTLSWTAFSFTQHCPGQCSVLRTALSLTLHPAIQHFSRTNWAISWTQCFPGQHFITFFHSDTTVRNSETIWFI